MLQFLETDITKSCLPNNKGCDVKYSLPLMVGLLEFQINEIIFQKMCPENCPSGTCSFADNAAEVLNDLDRILYYAYTVPAIAKKTWKNFFEKAIVLEGFYDLESTMALIKEKEEDFALAYGQCVEIKYNQACDYHRIYDQYIMLNKIQQNNGGDGRRVKDLRHFSKTDMKQMIQLQLDNKNHLQLLRQIRKLNNNLRVSVSGISRYLKCLLFVSPRIRD